MIFGSNPNLPIKFGSSYKSLVNLGANVPEAIFTPAANVRGAIVWTGGYTSGGGVRKMSFLAKTSAPTTTVDGDIIAITKMIAYMSSSSVASLELLRPVFIPAGKGLYRISDVAESDALAYCNYDLF